MERNERWRGEEKTGGREGGWMNERDRRREEEKGVLVKRRNGC